MLHFLTFLPLSSISHGLLFMLKFLGTLGPTRAVLELSYSEFSWSRPTLHLSDHSRWPKQRQFYRLKRILGTKVPKPQTRGDLDVALSCASHLLTCRSRPHHYVEQLPPQTRRVLTLYVLPVSSSFFLPRTMLEVGHASCEKHGPSTPKTLTLLGH